MSTKTIEMLRDINDIKKITIKNAFHNTAFTVNAWMLDGRKGYVTEKEANRADNALCGRDGCMCQSVCQNWILETNHPESGFVQIHK